MKRTYKHLLIPTKSQVRELERVLEVHRRLYNRMYTWWEEIYGGTAQTLSWYDMKHWLTANLRISEEFAGTNRNALDETINRLVLAYQRFFDRVKKKRKGKLPPDEPAGFPRYKLKDDFDSFKYVRHGNGFRIQDWPVRALRHGVKEWQEGDKRHRIYLQEAGYVRMWMNAPLEGKPKTCSVVREGGRWYVAIACEVSHVPQLVYGESVGIDVGLKNFLTCSNGAVVANPRHLRKSIEKIKKADRRVSTKVKGSRNRKKAQALESKLHRKIANQRKHFIYQVVNDLVGRYAFVAIEDLDVKAMVKKQKVRKNETQSARGERIRAERQRRRCSLSIADASWGLFKSTLLYKAQEGGVRVVLVDPRYTSQDCNRCGVRVPKGLEVRVHRCPECGLVEDRDLNAAKNILKKGLALVGPMEKADACIQEPSDILDTRAGV